MNSKGARIYYRLFGRRIRAKACAYTALALVCRRGDEALAPLAWSLTVFFERYIVEGAEGTREDFGPKEPVALRPVTTDDQR